MYFTMKLWRMKGGGEDGSVCGKGWRVQRSKGAGLKLGGVGRDLSHWHLKAGQQSTKTQNTLKKKNTICQHKTSCLFKYVTYMHTGLN